VSEKIIGGPEAPDEAAEAAAPKAPSSLERFRLARLGFSKPELAFLPEGLRLRLRPDVFGPAMDAICLGLAVAGIAGGYWLGFENGGLLAYILAVPALILPVVPRLLGRRLDAEISEGRVRVTERHVLGLLPVSWTEPLASYAAQRTLRRWTERQRARQERPAGLLEFQRKADVQMQAGFFTLQHAARPRRSLVLAYSDKGPVEDGLATEITQALRRAAGP